MAVRTTPELVQAILLDQYDGESDLAEFIATASPLVDYIEGKDSDGLLSDNLPELIERWLAAHAYAHADQLLSTKQTGRARGEFQGKTDMMFKSTQYGQMALTLDVTGTLAALQKQAEKGAPTSVAVIWGGTDYDTSSEFEDES